MLLPYFRLLLLFFLCSICCSTFAISLSSHKSGSIINNDYQYLIDTEFNLSYSDVQNSQDWQQSTANEISRGVQPQTVWMRFTLENDALESKHISLRYLDSTYQKITMYLDGSQTQEFLYGRSASEQPNAGLRPRFDLNIPAQTSKTITIKIIGSKNFAIAVFSSFELWIDGQVKHAEQRETFTLTALMCFQLAAALAGLISFFAVRDKAFLVYAIFGASTAISLAAMDGIWPHFIVGEGYQLIDIMLPLNVMHLSAFIFVTLILNLKKHFKGAWHYMRFWIAFASAGLIFDIIGLDIISRYMIEITALNYLSIVVVSFMCWRRKVPDALLLTATWLIFTIGATAQPLRNWGIIEHNFLSQWLLYIGAFIETGLLITILGMRLYRSNQKKLALEKTQKDKLILTTQQLEQKVDEQTLALKNAKEKAEHEARTDLLTGLANRRCFMEQAPLLVASAQRHQQSIHLALLDLDFFKKINDKYGHAAGDYVLAESGKLLRENSRDSDIVARIGGEEFAILMSNQDIGAALEFCERIRDKIARSAIQYNNQTIPLTASIGLASKTTDQTIDQLLIEADKALYMVKGVGRNKVFRYQEGT